MPDSPPPDSPPPDCGVPPPEPPSVGEPAPPALFKISQQVLSLNPASISWKLMVTEFVPV
ncbi:MAG: hypothetical protein COV29_03655 [Candidatus Yanofskybacteria bacterium CG10_big_fil_rev_8_21_14_0_10_36_16]|uniref:Uncharacterized protein n=1 Tax=Candidatus Yanofskybacteria bacterium CG10_big_fil_rev_8_21_14_0_10_36_16 TaxID=1975096 RepID=A0A2J0Q6J5_9BACT|nr:MAG: hypothetical protein COV29_03655 [Candidatus Yanofskybacteria bacterium CG10_big_fil_rev_8_21_14_0_10_36_16]